MKRRILTLVLALTIVCSFCIVSTASTKRRTETITVTYDDIKVCMDGEVLELKDANGQTVEPFIYNGTTYLPVRAISNAFGKDVAWDGIEKVAYLGTRPGETTNWMDQCAPYHGTRVTTYSLEENSYFTMSGKKYTDGLVLNAAPYGAEALFNLDGKYETLSFKAGHIDGTENRNITLNVYIDGIIAYTTELKYDDVARQITIPLNGALQMKIQIEGNDYWNAQWGFSEGIFTELD